MGAQTLVNGFLSPSLLPSSRSLSFLQVYGFHFLPQTSPRYRLLKSSSPTHGGKTDGHWGLRRGKVLSFSACVDTRRHTGNPRAAEDSTAAWVGPDTSESWDQGPELSETQPLTAQVQTHLLDTWRQAPGPAGWRCPQWGVTTKYPSREGQIKTEWPIPKAGVHTAGKGNGSETPTSAGRSHENTTRNECSSFQKDVTYVHFKKT